MNKKIICAGIKYCVLYPLMALTVVMMSQKLGVFDWLIDASCDAVQYEMDGGVAGHRGQP